MVALLIILYIIIAVLVIMGYIFYQTRIKHEKVNLDVDEDGDGWIFLVGLSWPISGIIALICGICHCIFAFFDWFAKSLEEEE